MTDLEWRTACVQQVAVEQEQPKFTKRSLQEVFVFMLATLPFWLSSFQRAVLEFEQSVNAVWFEFE